MKTIFIFNYSLPTDEYRAVMALGEDGQCVALIKFDAFTYPHRQFAMGSMHSFHEDDTDISRPVQATRAAVLGRYDEVFGAANWMPLWLDEPSANPDCYAALRRMRELNRPPVGVRVGFSPQALAGILGAIFGASDATPRTTH
ncbi:hypothetical protein [Paraburkholderia phenoliruptrix]|uniref:hypothetical protein n=1 Tax=Paraburkholderia phenoliruptrix TaxID=252970 RepID=UPI001C6E2308|nr:hypothetical protein [Paraburkholderia phenoliruptrix]MBW9102907.1 hypothetical protein [Paraburkholderia phenoliruptrix]MBW9132881.1 hypothetical protein [Paraburkholderia ginsengiterrae]